MFLINQINPNMAVKIQSKVELSLFPVEVDQ